jgi:hypothetical protein
MDHLLCGCIKAKQIVKQLHAGIHFLYYEAAVFCLRDISFHYIAQNFHFVNQFNVWPFNSILVKNFFFEIKKTVPSSSSQIFSFSVFLSSGLSH